MIGMLKSVLLLCAWAAPIADHEKEVQAINHKTEQFEVRIKELNDRKVQAREGEELEGVITEITNVHKELLGLRKERNALKEHLVKEHPDSNLLFEQSLHKSFTKPSPQDRGPLDDKLDSLLARMQSQYGSFLAKKRGLPAPDEKSAVKAEKGTPAAKSDVKEKAAAESRKLTPEEEKSKYMREVIKSEMKMKAAPGAVPKKPKEKKPEEDDKKEGGHEKPAGHH